MGSVISLAFDDYQIGWALRYIKEAESSIKVAKAASSVRASQDFSRRALSQSYRAFYELLGLRPMVDLEGQAFPLQRVQPDPMQKFLTLYNAFVDMEHDGRFPPSDVARASELMNETCLLIIRSFSGLAR
jgi:hypothetical protein